jgi:AcrR family transcriptional regulator
VKTNHSVVLTSSLPLEFASHKGYTLSLLVIQRFYNVVNDILSPVKGPMPRKPDSQLEDRIINAAYKLWVDGGEPALTMRAVAKAARTTTPTLYERFKDKSELLSALRTRAQQSLFDAIKPAHSIAEACRIALDFTVLHGHEYELVAKDWATHFSRKGPTPSLDLIKARLAEQVGGSPNDHLQLALALATLYHGASMMLLDEGVSPETASAIKEACIAATDSLVASARKPNPHEAQRIDESRA